MVHKRRQEIKEAQLAALEGEGEECLFLNDLQTKIPKCLTNIEERIKDIEKKISS